MRGNDVEQPCYIPMDPVTRVRTVWSWKEVEEACRMRMDTVTRGSHCFEMKRSGTSLLNANGHCYALFVMSADGTKWNKACCIQLDTVTRGSHCLELKKVEEACYMRIDTVMRASPCFELKRSGTSLWHGNAHRYAWFALFQAELMWNKLVGCEWITLRVVPTVRSWNQVEKACCMQKDTVTHGS